MSSLQVYRVGLLFLILSGINWSKAQECGVSSFADSRIVNGQDAAPGQWPWQAVLYIETIEQPFYRLYCGGTLINPRWILTAAHCVRIDFTITGIQVWLGVNDRLEEEASKQAHFVQEYYVHRDYIGPENLYKDDITLLKLATEVTYDEYVKPACLPSSETMHPLNGETCVISGFGTDGTASNIYILQYAQVDIIPYETCYLWYKEIFWDIPRNHFCAGFRKGGTDSCQGDSGGPLVCQRTGNTYVVFGITSFGFRCALPRRPGVYTDVASYLDWIYSITGVNFTTIEDGSGATPSDVLNPEVLSTTTIASTTPTLSTASTTSGSKPFNFNSPFIVLLFSFHSILCRH